MMKPKRYWIIQIESLENARTSVLREQDGKPKLFRSFSDAAASCAKLNRQLFPTGQIATILEKADETPKTRLVQ